MYLIIIENDSNDVHFSVDNCIQISEKVEVVNPESMSKESVMKELNKKCYKKKGK